MGEHIVDETNCKVSVIVPVYNVEKYLEKCLNSILNQTEKNIEVICIEDCSTDASADILYRISKKDERVQIIQNDRNMGLSYSRNEGIDRANGLFLMFVDSDDYIPACAIAEMYQYAMKEELQLLYCDVELVSEDERINIPDQKRTRKRKYEVTNGITLFQRLVENHEMFGIVCGTLYRTSLIQKNNLKFRNGILHEDIPFTLKSILLSDRAGCIKETLYYYVQRSGSIMSGNDLERRLEGLIISYLDMISIWHDFREGGGKTDQSIANFIHIYYRVINNLFLRIGSMQIHSPILKYLYRLPCNSNGIEIEQEDINIIKSCSRVAVYGAGDIAHRVLDYLSVNNIQVDAFIVTDLKNNPGEIRTVPVILAKKYLEDNHQKTAIILGVSGENRREIRKQLRANKKHIIIEKIGNV